MEKRMITINDAGTFHVPKKVRMQDFEIAQLFEVYNQSIRAKIRTIIKEGTIRPDMSGTLLSSGSVTVPLYFGLDMITAVAFRVDSAQARIFRQWVLSRLAAHSTPITVHMELSSDKCPS